MVGSILTPTGIWKSFAVNEEVSAEKLNQKKIGEIINISLRINGREVDKQKVGIYAEFYKKDNGRKTPTILLLEDFSINPDLSLVQNLIKQGYSVLCIDLAGKEEGKENYTTYPESISYANYQVSKDSLFTVEKDAKKTCWYEWSVAIRYALKYLKSLPEVTKVGGVAVGNVATALWQVAGTDKELDCAVFMFNSGWLGYREVYKFGGMVEPQFSDNMYKFIAGIDPQSYAMHISCPVLMLSATNNDEFDIDRAYDTISRINEQTYSAVYYSKNQINKINQNGYNNLNLFLGKFLQDKNTYLPSGCEIKAELVEGKLQIEVNGDKEQLKSVQIHIAEQLANPTLRTWNAINAKRDSDGKYVAEYIPFAESELVVMYATLKYFSGFSICSNIISKKFNKEEVVSTFKNNLIYSSRQENARSIFVNNDTSIKQSGIDVFTLTGLIKDKGPMGIDGITHKSGILSFMLCCKKYSPTNNSILMLDVYAKEQAELVVTLIADYFGSKVEYLARVNIRGGDIWHNVKIEINKFKTVDGMPLKDYSKIQACVFNVEGSEYLINNALWL